MDLAIQQARMSALENEVPVGAIVVSNNVVISQAHNLCEQQTNSLLHAEILAISSAMQILRQKYLFDCDIYVTLEPCPMCAAAISMAKLRRLYYAAYDSKCGAIHSVTKFFSTKNCLHIPDVYSEIYESVSVNILRKFFKNLRNF
jgi:tRNA(adenine34) deaminase